MIAVLRSTFSRETGKCISREVVEKLNMSEDEYYKPLVEVLGKEIVNKTKNIKKAQV